MNNLIITGLKINLGSKATAAKANGANTNIDSDSGERDGIFVERQGFPWI